MENSDVAAVLAEMADLLELTDGNAFKARAYRKAAGIIDTLPTPVAEVWRRDELDELPGVGAHMSRHIADLLERGDFAEHVSLSDKVPPGVIELMRIEGVGPKTAQSAWKKLDVTGVDELEEVCQDGRLAELPRMGDASAHNIASAILRYRDRKGRMLLHRALPIAESIIGRLRRVRGVVRAEIAGSARRRRETVGDLDLLVASDDPDPVMKAFRDIPEMKKVVASGETKSTGRLRSGLQVDVRVIAPKSFGAALHYFTGSKPHNIAVRLRAVRRKLKISEYGVFDDEGRMVGGETEEEVFRAVDLPWIPPELREGIGELEAAEKDELPRLVELDDLCGDLHIHSTDSTDGESDLEEIAKAGRRFGSQYLAITDHSRSRPLGLDGPKLRKQSKVIRELDKKFDGSPHLLTGVEVDILPDGSLDLEDEVLDALDWVVASVHSHFGDSREKMTERMVRALATGLVDTLGHPSGRHLGARDPSSFDLETVLEVARNVGVALEVNAQPDRLDLSDTACRMARKAGVKVVISTDAHHASQLENLRYGVWVARRGWLERSDVVNTLSWSELRRALGLGRAQVDARSHR